MSLKDRLQSASSRALSQQPSLYFKKIAPCIGFCNLVSCMRQDKTRSCVGGPELVGLGVPPQASSKRHPAHHERRVKLQGSLSLVSCMYWRNKNFIVVTQVVWDHWDALPHDGNFIFTEGVPTGLKCKDAAHLKAAFKKLRRPRLPSFCWLLACLACACCFSALSHFVSQMPDQKPLISPKYTWVNCSISCCPNSNTTWG